MGALVRPNMLNMPKSAADSRRFVQVESPEIKPYCAGLIKLCSTKTMSFV